MSRLPLRLREVVAVVLALCLGYVITSHATISGGDAKPFFRSAHVGSVARLSYADVKVEEVETAQYLLPGLSTSTPVAPAGIFVVVVVALTATKAPVFFTSAWLEDSDGRQFRASVSSTCPTALGIDSGLTTYAMFCFEADPSLLDQYHFELARGDLDNDRIRNDDVADIDLDISAARSRTLAATTTTYKVAQASLKPIKLKPIELKTATVKGAQS